MTPLKFRAYDKRLKKMYSPEDIKKENRTLGANGTMVAVDPDSFKDGKITLWNTDWITPLMSTGLYDRNKKEIFCGDVVKVFPNCANLKVADLKWNPTFPEDTEIIGNKFEHPSLLES